MSFNVRTLEDDVRVVDAEGQLDHHTGTAKMQQVLDPLKRIQGAKVIFNLKRVEYMCSAAIALLIEINDKLTANGGKFACCNIRAEIMEVLELLAIPEVIPCLGTEQEAIEALTGGAVTGA